jgi:hypothetical protein
MDQQRIILESSPAYVLVCAILAAGLAYLLYQGKHPWTKTWNWILTICRFGLLFALLFLLLGPIVKQVKNALENPLYVVLYDNSASVREAYGDAKLTKLRNDIGVLSTALRNKDYDVSTVNLEGKEVDTLSFNNSSTDLHAALRAVHQEYEGRNLAGVILPSDGIFNAGLSPVFGDYNFPIYPIGVGDTTERTDIAIKNIAYNRIAYQGNKFPVRVEVQVKNIQGENVTVKLLQQGKTIDQQSKRITNDQLLVFDFLPQANEQGIQKLDIEVEQKPAEHNHRNNKSSIFVEIVEGKKKILLIAASPHPDIKPLRDVVAKNSNYDFVLHIPGSVEDEIKNVKQEDIDLVILHQVPDVRGRTSLLFQQYLKSKASLLLILGQQSDLRTLAQNNMPVRFDAPPREFDQVTPVTNPAFNNFSLTPESASILTDYPPVSVHFGRMRIPLSSTPLLFQKVGSVSTEKPLLAIDNQDGRKVGIMLGEGLWRWKLNEYDRTEKTEGFDELFGKLIQFLSTTEDKRKFKSYPTQQDFSDTEAVVFESQVYNDIFEPVYGNKIDIEITNESGGKTSYNYVLSPGNTRYEIGGLPEGIYRYKSRTTIGGKAEDVRGEFAVVAKQTELQNLTADFDLLKKLASNTGGKFYLDSQVDLLQEDLNKFEAKAVIHSEESFNSLVNLKWVFWLLMAIVTLEWFARKFYGSY